MDNETAKQQIEEFNTRIERHVPGQRPPAGATRTLTAQEMAIRASVNKAMKSFEQVRMIVMTRIQVVGDRMQLVVPNPLLDSAEFGWKGTKETVSPEVCSQIVSHFRQAGYTIHQGNTPWEFTITIPAAENVEMTGI